MKTPLKIGLISIGVLVVGTLGYLTAEPGLDGQAEKALSAARLLVINEATQHWSLATKELAREQSDWRAANVAHWRAKGVEEPLVYRRGRMSVKPAAW